MDPSQTQTNADSENELLERDDEESTTEFTQVQIKSLYHELQIDKLSASIAEMIELFHSFKTKNASVEVTEIGSGSGTKRSAKGDLPLPPSKSGKSGQSTPALVGISYGPTNTSESGSSGLSANDSHSDSDEMEASIFDESTNLGPKVNDDLATRVNDSFTKKPLEYKGYSGEVQNPRELRHAVCPEGQ